MTNTTATSTTTTSTSARRAITIVAAGLSLLAFTGCSSLVEKATEKAVEEGVERAVEADTGEDVEIDFDADGNFSIETEDGSFSFEEDGSFELDTEDGTYTGQADDDGYVINDDDGVVVQADFDEDHGSFSLETEDGSITSGTDDEAWELWPTEIPRPDYLAEGTVAGSQFDDAGIWLTATGIADGEPADAIADYVAQLDGFDDAGVDAGENASVLSNGTYSMTVVADPAAGYAGDSILQVTVVTG